MMIRRNNVVSINKSHRFLVQNPLVTPTYIHKFMAINDPLVSKFGQLFPGFNGGMRELRFMVVVLEMDCDTYQNVEAEVKRQIVKRLQFAGFSQKVSFIIKYLTGAKVDVNAFDILDGPRPKLFLVEQKINSLIDELKIDHTIVCSLTALGFNLRDTIIFLIDYWEADTGVKKNKVSEIEAEIAKITGELKFLDWFDDNALRVESAKDYLLKNNKINFSEIRNSEDVRIYFYRNLENADYLKLTFFKIRSLFNNRKNRENKNKKQCNFSLSVISDKNISKLAEVNGMTRSDIVDRVFRNLNDLGNLDAFS